MSTIRCVKCEKEHEIGDGVDEWAVNSVGWLFRYEPPETQSGARRQDFCSLECAGSKGGEPWLVLCDQLRSPEFVKAERDLEEFRKQLEANRLRHN